MTPFSPSLAFLLPLALMQVGPDPLAPDTLGADGDLRSRPERRGSDAGATELSDPASRWLSQSSSSPFARP